MKEKYAFTWQSYGQCAQISLVNCLALLGMPITNKEAHVATGVHPIAAKINGTDSKFIKKALRYYGCNPIEFNLKDPDVLKRKADELLDKHIPLIISCDSWNHWAVLASKDGKRYYWIDSGNTEIIGYSNWDEIEDWIECEGTYYFIGAAPKDTSKTITDIPRLYSIYNKNELLVLQWGYILADLLNIFDSKREASKNNITANDFFTKYKDLILETIEYLYLDTDLEEITEKINDYQTVATMHNLVLPKADFEKALAYFSTLLTLAALCIE